MHIGNTYLTYLTIRNIHVFDLCIYFFYIFFLVSKVLYKFRLNLKIDLWSVFGFCSLCYLHCFRGRCSAFLFSIFSLNSFREIEFVYFNDNLVQREHASLHFMFLSFLKLQIFYCNWNKKFMIGVAILLVKSCFVDF